MGIFESSMSWGSVNTSAVCGRDVDLERITKWQIEVSSHHIPFLTAQDTNKRISKTSIQQSDKTKI